jgi:P-type Ca2+ transporter type 2C
VNLIMDTFAALALATEPPHDDVMRRPPRDSRAFIISPAMARSIFGVGGVFLAVLVAMLLWMQRHMLGDDSQLSPRALSIFFATFVMLQFWNLFNARCLGLRQSAFTGLTENRSLLLIAAAIFVGTVLLVQFGGEKVFRSVPLTWQEWSLIIGGTSLVLWFGELRRWMARLATA